MALNLDDKPHLQSFVLEGLGQKFTVKSPPFFHDLLCQTLTGWNFYPLTDCEKPDFHIYMEKEYFKIATPMAKTIPGRSDLIDTLNEFFLSVAYYVTAKFEGASLLHCAAYKHDGKNTIVFGKKNSGKSSHVFTKAKEGATILADDLLIWQPKSAMAICLGLPLRMRRPVIGLEGQQQKKPQFIAGKQTAYAQRDVFQIAKAGSYFTPDRIYQLVAHELKAVSFFKWLKVMSAHRISDDFLQLKDN